MSITRRQFLLSTVGAVGGFILPSFYTRALEFVDQFGEPLLESPRLVHDELIVCGDRDGELNLGDPYCELPSLTWREYAEKYHNGCLDELTDGWGLSPSQFDEDAPWNLVADSWCRTDSPNAHAYHLLDSLDLGAELSGPNAVGNLVFTDGACPGNDYLGVSAECDLTVSLLQQSLNDLGTGIRVVMG